MRRSLTLRRETLGSLGDDELSGVVGGWIPSRNGTGILRDCLATVPSLDCVVTVTTCTTNTQVPTVCDCYTPPNC